MSLKSRRKANKDSGKKASVNLLLSQRRTIRNAMLEYLGASVMFQLFALIIMNLEKSYNGEISLNRTGFIVVELFISAISVYWIFCFVRRLLIFCKIRKIKFSSEKTVYFYCKKVSFLLEANSKTSYIVSCIIFLDEGGNKYYYVYPNKDTPYNSDKNYIKEKYSGRELRLVCYKDTNVVKVLPE